MSDIRATPSAICYAAVAITDASMPATTRLRQYAIRLLRCRRRRLISPPPEFAPPFDAAADACADALR